MKQQESLAPCQCQVQIGCFVSLFLLFFDLHLWEYLQPGDSLDPLTLAHPVNAAVIAALALNAAGGAMMWIGCPPTFELCSWLLYPGSRGEPGQTNV
jgi:hypothetical protein